MEPTASPVSENEKRAALAAALASEPFARSEQLRAFLSFVCEMEISGRAGELTEYLIGVKALGRPPDYSPLEDSSVRTRAYELRQRLNRFYSTENPNAKIRIDLPKGSYAPEFIVGLPVTAPVTSTVVEKPPQRRRVHMPAGWLGGFLAGAAVASLAALLLAGRQDPSGAPPALKQAWAPLLSRDLEVLICVATPLHLQVTQYLATAPEDRPSFAAPPELYPLFSRYRDLPKEAKLQMEPVQKAVPMGNVEGIAEVLTTLQTLHARTRILPETTSPLSALRGKNTVLFGSSWYSRSAATLLEKTPWTLRWDEAARQVALVKQGTDGRKFLPRRGPRGEYQEVFGLVSVLPNHHSTDGDRTIVVFSGLTSVGTHGAAAFFTSGADLMALADRFRAEGLKGWPRAFQVVVRCRSSEDAQLLSYAYETHDVLIR
jgi:hypothetical protein